MVKNAGSKNKRGRLMKNMKSPNSGLTAIPPLLTVTKLVGYLVTAYFASFGER